MAKKSTKKPNKVSKKTSNSKKIGNLKYNDKNIMKNKNSIDAIKEDINKLYKIVETLKSTFNSMENTVNSIGKTMNKVTKTVDDNSEYLKKILDQSGLLSETELKKEKNNIDSKKNDFIEARELIDDSNFLDSLKKILNQLNQDNPEKKYEKIKIVKKYFKEKYIISDEKFDELLLENHWNQNIELTAGTGDYYLKDHFGNLYHNIKF